MGNRVMLLTQQIPEGEPVDFDVVKEEWNEYRLTDGSTLKIKLVLTGVLRLGNQYDPVGNPVYVISSQNAVRVIDVPPNLRRKTRPNTSPV